MKKKILSLLLACAMVTSVGSTALTAGAVETADEPSKAAVELHESAESYVYGDFEYSVYDDEVTITKYNGNESEVEIPSEIDNKPVTSIDYGAFYGCTGLTSISIPDSVTSIYGAFYGCTGLTSISIPDSVTSIGEVAFYGCTGLTSISIPDSVTYIGDEAFNGCTGLTNITIPDSVTYIGWYAFEGCDKLTIYGNAGSYAETFAKDNNIPFKDINTLVTTDTDSDTDSDIKEDSDTDTDSDVKKDSDTDTDSDTDPDITNEKMGDLDGDSKITSADALLVLRASVKLEDFDAAKNKIADVDGDGKVTSSDSLAILRYSVGFRDKGTLIQ